MTLTFNATEVQKLMEHSLNSPDHKMAYGDIKSQEPGLWIVGDDGIYLMSNGLPGLADGKQQKVVYANECDPTKMDFDDWWENKNATFGSDDGCEYFSLESIKYDPYLKLAKFEVILTPNSMNIKHEQHEIQTTIKPKPKNAPRKKRKG